MIDLNNITIRIGAKVLLDHASAHIADGWKAGIVGPNGCGKSTLLHTLQGEQETESGSISFPEQAKIAYVAQDIGDTSAKILDFVLAQDKERSELLSQLEKASATETAEIHERLKTIEAASAPARASAILSGLGFDNNDLSRPVSEFSGGWRMRLALAAALFQPSDILLLDEPTNHLDLEASIWLENHLRKYRGTLLLISHDRSILNSLCNYIIHFDHQKLITYGGNYDTFRQTRAEQKELLEKQYKKQEQKRRHLESFVERFRYKASKAKQAQSRIKMLEKLAPVALMEDEASAHFDFPEPEELAPPLITLENVSTGYGDKTVLRRLNLSIVDNDRIALLGANGNGKSTFAKLISGRLEPWTGVFHRSPKLKVGYFAQHQSEELPLEMTAAEYMGTLMPDKTETAVRTHLARFGLEQEKALTRIDRLSGGEKARLLFAAMSRNAPNLLVLDEPTNHLDMEARDALVEALNAYKGSVILITHDFNLIELVADDLWLVAKGGCRPYAGDLNDYKQFLLSSAAESKNEQKLKRETEKQKQETRQKAQAAKAADKERKARLRQLEQELTFCRNQSADLTELFQSPLAVEELIKYQKELKQLNETIDRLENEWLELSVEN